MTKREEREALADQKYWQDFAVRFGLICYGFTGRDSAGFHDARGESSLPITIPGWLARRMTCADGVSEDGKSG